jgi:hypothetical protein
VQVVVLAEPARCTCSAGDARPIGPADRPGQRLDSVRLGYRLA